MSTADVLNDPAPADSWEFVDPEEAGFDPDGLQEAIAYTQDSARAGGPPDLGAHLAAEHGSKKYDDGVILGPTKTHGGITGLVMRNGRIVTEWGNPERVDMTFSISRGIGG